MTGRVRVAAIRRVGGGSPRTDQDLVAVEAPLTILVSHTLNGTEATASPPRSLGLLMRTPGDDRDLVLGLLHSEGVIRRPSDVLTVELTAEALADGEVQRLEQALVVVADHVDLDAVGVRAMTGTSACGLCGQLTMHALDRGRVLAPDAPTIAASLISSLPDRLRAGQSVFDETGGLHAAGLFDLAGALWALREDVGRHNAVDKVVGAALAAGRLPATDSVLVVSGRVAYEIVQKAAAAGVVAIVAVGAPSSLAVEAARATNMTLVGFARDGKFNVYAGAERIGV